MAIIDPRALTDLEAVAVTTWWLGNAGFAINAAGTLIFIDPVIELHHDSDPVISEIGLPLLIPLPVRASKIDRADIVLISHDDGDHLAPRTVPELIARTHALFVGTARTARKLRGYGLPEERIRVVRYNHTIRVGDVTITPTVARHAESEGHTKRGDCCGFVVNAAGITFWHPNDTELLDDHLKVKGIDVLLLPIAPHVLGTEGAIRLAESTGAPHVIPCHYGTYDSDLFWCQGDPAAVAEGVSGGGSRYCQLAVGESLVLPAG